MKQEENAKLMERESPKYAFRKGEFPSPSVVLEAALDRIAPDGSVQIFDEEENSTFCWENVETIDLSKFPSFVYDLHLLQVSRSIYGTVLHISRWPKNTDRWVESLAIYLATYRHNPNLFQQAIELGKVDKNGFLIEPRSI
jgi:hypothetical protein